MIRTNLKLLRIAFVVIGLPLMLAGAFYFRSIDAFVWGLCLTVLGVIK